MLHSRMLINILITTTRAAKTDGLFEVYYSIRTYCVGIVQVVCRALD